MPVLYGRHYISAEEQPPDLGNTLEQREPSLKGGGALLNAAQWYSRDHAQEKDHYHQSESIAESPIPGGAAQKTRKLHLVKRKRM